MNIELIHIGFGNVLAMNRVIAVASPNSAPTRRIIKEGKNKGLLIDMTNGRKTKAVIFTDSGHIVLAALAPETIASRIQKSWERLNVKTEEPEEKENVIQQGKSKGIVIDMTSGKKTQSVIFTDNGHIILAAVSPETITAKSPSEHVLQIPD
jgi:extracellular matrix regulatory protein A